MTTHYQTLGVDKNADDNTIKKAYRSLSLKFHPDRNKEPSASEKIKDINAAYEILGDKDKKQTYDNELNGVQMNPGNGFHNMNPGNGFHNMNHVFNMMFNGMPMNGSSNVKIFRNGNHTTQIFTNHSIQKPQVIVKHIEISLEEAYNGKDTDVIIQRWVQENNTKKIEEIPFKLTIPKGVNDGETIMIHNQGNIINQQSKGDIKLIILIKNTSDFKRDNLDLIYYKKITLKESLCGFSFEFIHLSGKKLGMNNTNPINIIKPGYKKIVPSMGMIRDNNKGNLIFEFEIEYPESLTNEQMNHIANGLP